jgi:hypothetical protein
MQWNHQRQKSIVRAKGGEKKINCQRKMADILRDYRD